MDIEKLIERLSKYSEPVIAYKLDADFAASITDAISELRCKCDGCSVPATTAEMIRDLNDAPKLRAENEKLRAELEKVKAERDAAVSWAQKYTESIDRPCVACKHNTGDYVCTAICGNCGPMGAESCKWEFDFSGELKED